MLVKKIHLDVEADVIDEEIFAENYTPVFSYLAEEGRRRRSVKRGLDFVVSTNDRILNAVYQVGVDKKNGGHREEFIWLMTNPYNSGLGNRYVKITGCDCKEILLKVLAVCLKFF